MTPLPVIAIVIPCYNEAEALPVSTAKIREILMSLVREREISNESYILCVDDGSTDGTWNVIEKLSDENRNYRRQRDRIGS